MVSATEVMKTIFGMGQKASSIVVVNIRLPRIIAAAVAGWGLSISGMAMQTLLKNPLGSPFTLGISQAAAFGAALAIVVMGGGGLSGAGGSLVPVAALVTAFHGVVAFVGLLAPHMAKRLCPGAEHRILLMFSSVLGAQLLLAADTADRVLVGSGALPVGVLTSFMGVPLFLYLLIRRNRP